MPTGPNAYPATPIEATRELVVGSLEMQDTARLAQECLDIALENDWAVVSDRSLYLGIHHSNGLRTLDSRLAFRDTRFSTIDIDLPRKDEDVRIKITAHAMDLPGRTITLQEFAHPDERGQLKFFADDSHAVAFARNSHPIDPVIEQAEVADWLYAQAGLLPRQSKKKIATESDPVRNASDILSLEAKQHFTIRQVKLPLGPDLELHGQLVESLDTNNPLSPPIARKYTAWVNQHHAIGGTTVTERLFVEFSPDDVWLALDVSPISSVRLMLETTDPRFEIGRALVRQVSDYDDGGVMGAFATVRKQLEKYRTTAKF